MGLGIPEFLRALAALVSFSLLASAQSESWSVAQDEHFQIYSQAGPDAARLSLLWFEQLRSFFLQQTRLQLGARPPVRVIGFRSSTEYAPYRRGVTSEAYYVGTDSSDYIVMSSLDNHNLGVAAHEYAHLMLHASGLHLPLWLSEGLAEFYSTVQINKQETRLGGVLPARARLLERRPWIPLRELLAPGNEFRIRNDRDFSSLFYAESWALTQMLVLSPRYSHRFDSLILALSADPTRAGSNTSNSWPSLFGNSLHGVQEDLQNWLRSSAGTTVSIPPIISEQTTFLSVAKAPMNSVHALLAGLFLASGDLGRAESIYRNLTINSQDGAAQGALAVIALMNHDPDHARFSWNNALQGGIPDPDICFRYAMLAQDAGLSFDEVRPALERAVKLRPSFDDARYNLALLESNSGNYQASLTQLQAIQYVPPARTYNYWSCLGYVLNELDRRLEAKSAAETALRFATTPEERTQASRLAYLAQTDLTVQFARDSSGRLQLVTARMRHNATDWNPFIEPSDVIRHVRAKLQSITCDGGSLSVQLDDSGAALIVAIPDPTHVQMRNAPAQFTCGPQPETFVDVDYAVFDPAQPAAGGIIRGMDFGAP